MLASIAKAVTQMVSKVRVIPSGSRINNTVSFGVHCDLYRHVIMIGISVLSIISDILHIFINKQEIVNNINFIICVD